MRIAARGGYDRAMAGTRFDRSFATDSVLAVVLFAAALMSLSSFPPVQDMRSVDIALFLLIGAQTLTLAWRRQFPTAVLVIITAAFMIERGLNYPQTWAYFGIAFALYTVGAQVRFRRSRLVAGTVILLSVAWTAVGTAAYDIPWTAVAGVLLYLTFPWLIGVESRRREQRALDLEARAIRAEMTTEHEAAEAVQSERVRIARELHDVVAHEMTVMTVQASAAQRVLDSDPEQARLSMKLVGESGRRGLAEMRRLLGLLRYSDDPPLDPQPGLDSLEDLTHQLNEVGQLVELEIAGSPRPLPAGIDLNAYRIVQESLTNTARHAGPNASATVVVNYGDVKLDIDVTDDGRGAAQGLEVSDSGHGLIGMQERVALLDGSLAAGPRTGGGYRVHAIIPIPRP